MQDYVKLCAVILLGLVISGSFAVHPDYILTRLTESLQAANRKDDSSELTALATSRQCCKLGEKMGYRGFPCNMELHVTSRTDNIVFKQKRKYEFQESDGGKRNSLSMTDVSKCLNHRKLFEKCCSHRFWNFKRSSAESDSWELGNSCIFQRFFSHSLVNSHRKYVPQETANFWSYKAH